MRIRTLFISDTHIGSRHSQPEKLLKFLNSVECYRIYLVGDFIEGWHNRKWTKEECSLIKKILSYKEINYIIGNHDDFLEPFTGLYSLDKSIIRIRHSDVYQTLKGKRLLVTHGHDYDDVNTRAHWLSIIGDYLYHWMIDFNRLVKLVFPNWTFSKFLKNKTKKIVNVISHFEERMHKEAKEKLCDGIICGHIHTPEISEKGGFTYINTGDWIESNSAVYEDLEGNLKLWTMESQAGMNII